MKKFIKQIWLCIKYGLIEIKNLITEFAESIYK